MAIHSFDSRIAEQYGLEQAILLNNFDYFIDENKNNKNIDYFHNGCFWLCITIEKLSIDFPYMTKNKIRNALKSLEEKGIIISGSYNKNKFDHSKWYAITEKGMYILKNKGDNCD